VGQGVGIEDREFVRVVVGASAQQGRDKRRLPGATSSRHHQTATVPADHARVHEQDTLGLTRGLQLGLIRERLEKILQVVRARDRHTLTPQFEAVSRGALLRRPQPVVDGDVAGNRITPSKRTHPFNRGGEHRRIGGAETERDAEGRQDAREIDHVRMTSPAPALVA
jgi:hypothetical protein